jgi:hypothetical protein
MKRCLFLVPLLLMSFQSCSFATDKLGVNTEEEKVFFSGKSMTDRPLLEKAKAGEKNEVTGGITDVSVDRKVIYTGDVRIEVKLCDKSIEKIRALVKKVNGVVADESVAEQDEGRKTAVMVIRVPADKFRKVFKKLDDIGKIKSQSTKGDDITEQYFDLETRLKNAKRMETRLIDLLENKSKSLKDMLEVEKELGRVRESIETMEGRKRYFDKRVAMSTITINIFEPYKYSSSIFEPVRNAFNNAGEIFMKSLGAVMLFLAAAVPWLVLLFIIVYVMIFFVKRWFRKRKKAMKKSEKNEDEQAIELPPKREMMKEDE